jgi:DNA recombination protein Rad52
MPFTDTQIKALSNKLSFKHVRTRQSAGKTLSYIEGWHTIAEANRIFGYDAWDRQTLTIKCVWEGMKGNRSACSYIARVRVKVRAGDAEICREGCGSGHGTGLTPGEAHESAIKEAETDAMKRALTTFGNPFGLALYDKEQQNVRGRKQKQHSNGKAQALTWIVLSSEGEYISADEDPVDYCKSMRQQMEAISTRERLRSFWQRNLVTIAMMRRNLPDLKAERGEHYADILTALYKRRLREMHGEVSRRQGGGGIARTHGTKEPASLSAQETVARQKGDAAQSEKPIPQGKKETGSVPDQGTRVETESAPGQIDKSALPISAPRRVRDKEHLRYVARQPCLICGRSPGQAHHLRFAQPRALGRKVSDEWVVPLCATHHRALHGVGDEKQWWKDRGIDPIGHARIFWWTTRFGNVSEIDGGSSLRLKAQLSNPSSIPK